MIAKDSFIILQSGTELTGALCRVGLKSRDVSYLHHVTCADLTPHACPPGPRCSGTGPSPSARGPRWSKRFP